MNICIIGGGLCGLVAGLRLSKSASVDIFEKKTSAGGLLSSYHINTYDIETFYHHCFSGDKFLLELLNELSLENDLEWLSGSTGYYINGSINPLTTPFEILMYPHLSLTEKIKLGLFTLKSGNISVADLDQVPAGKYIRDQLGEGLFSSFFEPLLKAKFGEKREHISASWLVSRVSIRSDRGAAGERLGYLKGGFSKLIKRLLEECEKNSCNIRTGEKVTTISRNGEKWIVNGIEYDAVLSTIPPQVLAGLGGPGYTPVPYQGAACMTIGLSREVTDGIYWVNIRDNAPYGAVIGHTNMVPRERYGEDIVYLASYFTGEVPDKLEEKMLNDFCERFSVLKEEIHWHKLAVEPYAGPLYVTGYKKQMEEFSAQKTDMLYMAGMFSAENYPERSIEGSIQAGERIAKTILSEVA